ncbi:peptidyl-prolyl cis-trans isomerase [Thalassobacillus hwangdonensis]|uniref:peptidylprolyl isomerase n=1 Tax=Thalassobacillus hwangdonensis TaxID=546108 RepID=A0ABW3L594_9BACI
MNRKVLWGLVSLLVITNLLTLYFWSGERSTSPKSSKLQDMEVVEASDEVNEPVALINGEEVSYVDWVSSLKQTYGKKTLEDMVNKQLVFQLAEEHDLTLEPKLIDRELHSMETMQGVSGKEELEQKQEQWRKDIEYQLYLEEILTRDVEIAEEDIKKYFEKHKDDYTFSKTYQLSQIVVNNKKEADKVYKELEEGSDFSVLAREYSDETSSGEFGGYLGYYSENTTFLDNAYFNAAEKLEEGQYSQPFEAPGGYVVIYLHRTLPEVTFTYDELKAHIRRELALGHISGVATADMLWEQADIDWIYGE